MKYARILYQGIPQYALLKPDGYHLLSGGLFDPVCETGAVMPEKAAQLLVPCTPGKIIAVGLNYADHAAEMSLELPQFPALFMKPSSALLPCGGTILYPPMSRQVDFEGELAFVIGKTSSYVPERAAAEHIFGYTCLNDVTARDLQGQDSQWTRAKGFDTFCPVGPVIAAGINPASLRVTTRVNGTVRQDFSTRNLIFTPEKLVSLLSQIMTLYPGDLITTGTSSGIGPMFPGDEVEVEIAQIGTLKNTVKELCDHD